MPSPLVQFRARPDDFRRALEARWDQDTQAPGSVARKDLQRYYALLEGALPDLSRREANFLIDLLQGLDPRPKNALRMHLEVLDASEETAQEAGINRAQLADKLNDPLASVAVLDAVERFWLDPTQDPASLGLCPSK